MSAKLIILSGPSGVGKGTIREELLVSYKDLDFWYSISMTTRKPRLNEIDGKDYYFVSKKSFLEKVAQNDFLEWAKFSDNYYGTPLSKVKEKLASGINVFLEIEVQGAKKILQSSSIENIISIFLIPPSINELTNRIVRRKTDSQEQIDQRLMKANLELKEANNYKYQIINDDIKLATKQLYKIIKAEIQ